MTKEEYIKKYGKKTNKCLICKKHYRLPTFIYEPRDKICFTCELKLKILCKDCGEATKDSIAEELDLCQECWEDECDKDWWKEVKNLIKKQYEK
jgi:hypothetical protein